MKKKLFVILSVALILLFTITTGAFLRIHRQVKKITLIAMNEYELNAIESLTELIKSEDHNFDEKNSAIWALGQFADKKALPFLEELNSQTGDNSPCYWFEFDEEICKYELEKAIKWCRQGNRTSWMYRNIE